MELTLRRYHWQYFIPAGEHSARPADTAVMYRRGLPAILSCEIANAAVGTCRCPERW